MFPVLIGLLVFAAVGGGLTYWSQQKAQPQAGGDAPRRGAEQLSQLRWRDFVRLVLQAMQGRGYHPVIEPGGPADGIPTDGSNIVLSRGDERALLSCQYGTGATIGSAIVNSAVTSASLRGIEQIIIVTPGRFESDAARLAAEHRIELIDGETLWPEVRPYVAHPDQTPAPVSVPPQPRALAGLWGIAVVAGGIAWAIAGALQPNPADEAAAATPAPTPAVAAPAHRASDAAPAASPAADSRPALPGVPTDIRELDQRRKEAANAVATLYGVQRAIWSSQSTLLVYLSSATTDPMNDICPLLEQYPELAASRIQLQPPEGSDKAVRFTHCRAY